MKKVLVIGADVHAENIQLEYAVGKGASQQRSFPNRHKAWPKLVEFFRREANRQGAQRIVLGYEACGLGFALHDHLRAAGMECHVLAPTRMKRSPQAARDKTDAKDARRIFEELRGYALAGNTLPAIWVPDEETRDAREVVRARVELGEKITREKVQIQALLKRQGLEKPEGLGANWSKPYRAWLRGLGGPRSHLPWGARQALATQLRQLAALEQEGPRLDLAVGVLAQQPRYAQPAQALDRLAGVRVLTALVFLTELGDVYRFHNRRQVGAYLGLAPSCHESGAAQERKGHITRHGSARLRRCLCQATWARIRTHEPTQEFYDRLVQRSGRKKMIAVVACMRKLGIRMWRVAKAAQTTGVTGPPARVAAG